MDMNLIPAQQSEERGFGMIETLIAMVILIAGLAAVMGLFVVSATYTHEQGNVAARATTYTETKMEELLALDFTDATTNTTVWPYTNTGTGLCGGLAVNTGCGSVDPAAPLTNYVDYLDFQGTRITNAALAFFTRQWRIDMDSTSNLKTITVRTSAKRRLGPGTAPSTVLVSYKAR